MFDRKRFFLRKIRFNGRSQRKDTSVTWSPLVNQIPGSMEMSPLQRIASLLYRAVRRLSILDVTRLMHLPPNAGESLPVADGYEIRALPAGELRELIASQRVDTRVGDPGRLYDGRHALVVALRNDRVVSYVWFAHECVEASDNFSRASHLGTSIDLPDGSAFVYNAWTDPEHRGRRLIAAILSFAVRHRVAGACALLTSIDWTNGRSIRAFEHIGMISLGTVVRFGWGPLQVSLIPRRAQSLGVRVGAGAPGLKFAC